MDNKFSKEIIGALQESDPKAFETVFSSEYRNIKNFIARLINSDGEAEELAQDVFMIFWERRQYIKDDMNISGYLHTISRNLSFKLLRKRHRENALISDLSYRYLDSLAPSNEDVYYERELNILFLMSIEELPIRRREIFQKSFMEGLSDEEVAAAFGVSEKTVQNQVNLALNEIKQKMIFFTIVLCSVSGSFTV